MSQELNSLARIGLAGAIVDTYDHLDPDCSESIVSLLGALRQKTYKAMRLYRVTASGLNRIDKKITALKKQSSLGKPLSIITLIEFVLAILDEPARKCKRERKKAHERIIKILLDLRKEITGDREFFLSSMAAAKAADIWESIEI